MNWLNILNIKSASETANSTIYFNASSKKLQNLETGIMIPDISGVFPRHVTVETARFTAISLFSTNVSRISKQDKQTRLTSPAHYRLWWPMKARALNIDSEYFEEFFIIIILPKSFLSKKKFHHKVVRIEITYQYPSVLILDICPISAIRIISGIRLRNNLKGCGMCGGGWRMARLPGKNTGKRAAELRMLAGLARKEQIFRKTLALQLQCYFWGQRITDTHVRVHTHVP